MKNSVKIIFAVMSLMVVLVSSSFAQGKASFQDIHFTTHVAEGSNAVPIPGGNGTLRFMLRNGQILNVMIQDASGKLTRVAETEPGSTGAAPMPECKWEERCVYNQEKGTAVCFCMPNVITSGEPVQVALLLPAIQKVREAAGRF